MSSNRKITKKKKKYASQHFFCFLKISPRQHHHHHHLQLRMSNIPNNNTSSLRPHTLAWRECWISQAGGNSIFQCIGKMLEGIWRVYPVTQLQMHFVKPTLDDTGQISIASMRSVRRLMAIMGMHEASKDLGLMQPLKDWGRLYFQNDNWASILLEGLDEIKNTPKPSILLRVFWSILKRYRLNVSLVLISDTSRGLRACEKALAQSAQTHDATRHYCIVKIKGAHFTLLSYEGSIVINEQTFKTAITMARTADESSVSAVPLMDCHATNSKDEQMSCALAMLGLCGVDNFPHDPLFT